MSTGQTPYRRRIRKGAVQAATLLERQIREVGESRGFAVSRLLTRWDEVAGPEIARLCRPVDVSFARGGMGATLTVLTSGAQAPMLEMQKERLREKVNACYGYQAIRRIRITQTAPGGFREGGAGFDHAPRAAAPPRALVEAVHDRTEGVADPDLRAALDRLGTNVLAATTPRKGMP